MKLSSVLVFALLAVTSSPAWAVDDELISQCAIVSDNMERLSCFDAVARDAGLDGPQPVAIEGVGNWNVTRERGAVLAQLVDAADGATFIARCQFGQTEAYVLWNDNLGSAGSIDKPVTIQIGSGAAVSERWSLSNDAKAVFSTGFAPALLKRMAADSSFTVQTTARDQRALTAVFDTSGMSAALLPLVEVCGWRL